VQHQPIHLTDEHFGDVRAFLRFAAAKKKADLFLTLPAVRGVQKIMLAWQARMELVEDFRAYVALHAARLVFCSVNPNATGNINAHANTAELETEAHSPSRGHLIALLRNVAEMRLSSSGCTSSLHWPSTPPGGSSWTRRA